MRQSDINKKLFHRGHYEIIAARFRESLALPMENGDKDVSMAIIDLAMNLARRFQADNEDFSPEMFMNRCSPDPVKYPLEELWRDES